MKTFLKVLFAVFVVLGLMEANITFAATTPSLGVADTYGVLAGTYSNSSSATTVNGDIGFTTGPATAPLGTHANYGSGAPTSTARIDAGNALTSLASQPCTFNFVSGAIDLSTDGPNGATGVYAPGVYCSTGAMNIGVGGMTLNGSGTYIFRAVGSLTSTDNSHITWSGSGASACNIFWTPTAATTLGANTTFVGTIIDNANAITVGANTTWTGQALSLGAGTVTTGDTDTITVPVCSSSLATLNVIKQVVNNSGGIALASAFALHVTHLGVDVTGSPATGIGAPGTSYALTAGTYVVSEDANISYTKTFSGDCDASGTITLTSGDDKTCTITNDDIAIVLPATINVVKTVINDNGKSMTIADFPLFVNSTPVISGVTNTFPLGAYTITETTNTNYTQSFSGDCDSSGNLSLLSGDAKTCIITNDDKPSSSGGGGGGGGGGSRWTRIVPPLIDVVKVPSPLALPAGRGLVTYTYTLRNIGIVPVTKITLVGDTCSPIVLISGDINTNAKLDINETWTHTCSTTLAKTHTNTVVATGWANGVSATDIASATVVVGAPVVVPPLIHVTKVPHPLTLPAEGGMITYTEKITNPGTVALSNVRLTDDKCRPMKYISGDTNSDAKLNTAETWTYTCRTNLAETTTNTAIARGEGNGLTVRDFAIATVVVAPPIPVIPPAPVIPKLPNTGFPPEGENIPWNIVFLSSILVASVSFYVVLRKKA